MNSSSWQSQLAQEFSRLSQSHLYRDRIVTREIDATHVERNGRVLVNFASNDYLGLTHHPKVLEAAIKATQDYGTGSGASPLVSGYGPAQQSAERAIARWKGSQSAILLPSGYQANHAAIKAVARLGKFQNGVRFLMDKLVHASLIDAIRATGQPFRIFPHQGLEKLQRLLDEADENQLQVVVTESIFSMDGDATDLRAVIALKKKYGFFLLLDEAHATGIWGPAGNGLAAECGVTDEVDASIITLSKALGGIGGAVCGSELFCQAVVNWGRAYVFSTGLTPSAAAAAEAAIDVVTKEPQRRSRLHFRMIRVGGELRRAGFHIPTGSSPIIPIIFRDESAALAAARQLEEQGILIVAIRPPTVPKGSSRLRITLSSEHTDAEIDSLIAAVSRLKNI